MPNTTLRIELFGSLRVFLDGTQVPIKSQRIGSLLGLLALEMPGSLSRAFLAEVLWPERPPEAGRNSLSVALHGLRQMLEPTPQDRGTVLNVDVSHLGLNPDAVSTDIHDFERAIAENRLDEAVTLYRPDLARGHYLTQFTEVQERLQNIAIKLHEDLVVSYRAEGRLREALRVNAELLGLSPFNENAHVRLIELNLESGNRASALEAYDTYRRMLKVNFGAEPSPEVEALAKDLKPTHGTALVAPEVTSSQGTTRTPLPVRLTKFFGRSKELELLGKLLTSESKLITVTGMGGIGKTRLLEEALKVQSASPDPPFLIFVPLASKESAVEALTEVGRAVNPGANATDNPVAQIARTLAAQRSVLILDNLEHLLNSDGIEVATLIENLAGSIDHLTVLCTSRVPIEMEGEVVLRLEALPDLGKSLAFDEVRANPRVQLYVDRAQNSNPEFELTERNFRSVAAISAWLEGVPLAIELAAACARTLPPKLLLTRLQARLDIPEPKLRKGVARHRSIRAVLDTSYELLNPDDRLVFCVCSLFRGGLFKDSLDLVLGFDSESSLAQLTRSCLLQAESTAQGTRWRMLEMVREFAETRLSEEAEPSEVKLAFAKTLMAQAEALRQGLAGHAQRESLARMQFDRDNYVHALDVMLDRIGMREDSIRMVASLWRFWSIAGLLNVGRPRLEKLLLQCESSPIDGELMAQANNIAGNLAYSAGDYQKARLSHERALLHYRQEFQAVGLVSALNNIALASLRLGQLEVARHSAKEAVVTAEEQGLADLAATALGTLGLVEYTSKDYASAAVHLESAAEKFRALGNAYAAGNNLRHLSRARFALGDRSYVRLIFESLKLAQSLDSQALMLSILMVLVDMCLTLSHPEAASTIFATVQSVRKANAVSYVPGDATLEAEVAHLVVPAEPAELESAIELAQQCLDAE
ncbi:MAG: AAA family ATPase [Fimbriimonadaceae bacterium]|nr:AAA family ATPase [Fimbriimonadaceae bacterium]